MPILLDVLYREYCRARLLEMRKQLLLLRASPVALEEKCDAGHFDNGADGYVVFGSFPDRDSHAGGSRS